MNIKLLLILLIAGTLGVFGASGTTLAQQPSEHKQIQLLEQQSPPPDSTQLGISQEAMQKYAWFVVKYTELEEEHLISDKLDDEKFHEEVNQIIRDSSLDSLQIQKIDTFAKNNPVVREELLEYTSDYHEIREWSAADKEKFADYIAQRIELVREYKQQYAEESAYYQQDDFDQLQEDLNTLIEESPLDRETIIRMEADFNLDREFQETIREMVH